MYTEAADEETLNVGSTDHITLKTLATEFRDRINPGVEIVHTERHDVDAEHTSADVAKTRAVFGYELSQMIHERLAKFIEWYRANREWYEPLVRSS